MTPLYRLLASILLAVVLLAGGYLKGCTDGRQRERKAWEAATAEQGRRYGEALENQQRTVERVYVRTDIARKETRRQHEQLDAALGDWGSQPIPDGVRETLRAPAMPADTPSSD